jgi:chaperonin cofactor prefoldin
MATSVLDYIRAVEHQKVKVKTETLRKVKQALNELNKLGFDYRVVGNGSVSEPARRRSRTLKDALQNLRLSHLEAA